MPERNAAKAADVQKKSREELDREHPPETAEGEKASELSEKVPDVASGEDDTPLGSTDQHSDAPGPHGTGEDV